MLVIEMMEALEANKTTAYAASKRKDMYGKQIERPENIK